MKNKPAGLSRWFTSVIRATKKEMEIQIKLTKEQHDLLLDHLGSEESIHEWLQDCFDRKMQEMTDEVRKASDK